MRVRGGYVVAATALVGGIGLAVLVLFQQLRGVADGLQQVVVPGEHEIVLAEAGSHTIFHEERAVVGGRYFASDRQLNGLKLRLEALPSGDDVPIGVPSARTSYTLADREGSSIATFTVSRPGTYRLTAWYPEAAADPTAVLAIGQGVEARLMTAIFGSLASAIGGLLAGAVIAIVTFVRGRQHTGQTRHEEVHVKPTVLGIAFGLLAASHAFAQAKPPLASVEARWPEVYCDLTELSRTSETELTVRYRYRNTAKSRFLLPHIDLVPRARLLDQVGKTVYAVVKDTSGNTVGSTTMDGITGRPIPPGGTQAHWVRFEAPPADVTSLTILAEACQPFDDVPLQGAPATVQQATPTPTVASQEGEAEGLIVEITGVRRGLGGALTLTFRYRNTGTGPYNFPHRPVVREAYLLDSANRRKYEVIQDRKQQPICAETLNLQFPDGVSLKPGEAIALWAKFPAPPGATKTVSVHLPFAPPFDKVELSGAASGSESGGSAVAGSVVGLDAALKDLGAKVTETEIRIDLAADVLFDFDKADIKKEAEPSLQNVATVLKANQSAKVSIEGHTDGKGADAYNQTLSEQRAASVKQWLVANAQVNGANVATRGWGKTKPVAHNTKPDGSDDPEGRAKNRRVEIVVRKG